MRRNFHSRCAAEHSNAKKPQFLIVHLRFLFSKHTSTMRGSHFWHYDRFYCCGSSNNCPNAHSATNGGCFYAPISLPDEIPCCHNYLQRLDPCIILLIACRCHRRNFGFLYDCKFVFVLAFQQKLILLLKHVNLAARLSSSAPVSAPHARIRQLSV